MKVKEFIESNVNLGVVWEIDGEPYKGCMPITEYPNYLLEKNVDIWGAIQSKGIIVIRTKE